MNTETLTLASIHPDFMKSSNTRTSHTPFLFTMPATGVDDYWDDNDLEESNNNREEDEDEWDTLRLNK